MNCKPGDLAMIVNSANGVSLGKLVRCIRLSEFPGLCNPDGTIDIGPVWETDHMGFDCHFSAVHNLWMDKDLRPIRDPGDDARDETLDWLTVPTKEGMPA